MAKEETVQERSVREAEERDAIQPTPTPEEVDRAKLGAAADEADAKPAGADKSKTVEAAKAATYQTRDAKPA